MQATVHGVRMGYTDEGQGLPVLFVHGFPLSRGIWQKQVDAFRSSHRVIAPDLRGFGESATKPGTATMAQFAADLHALLQKLKTGPVVLVGHSMGGYIAFAFARKFPEMLRGLVLVGTRPGNDTAETAAGRRTTADKVKAEGPQAVIKAMAPKMLSAGNQDPGMPGEVRHLMVSSGVEGVIGALLGMAERPDVTEMLPKISVPTLVVTGADDTIIPSAESEKMAQVIPGAWLEVIPHAGHLVAFERADEFNRAMKTWIGATGESGRPSPGQRIAKEPS